jgi:hypothetical protein
MDLLSLSSRAIGELKQKEGIRSVSRKHSMSNSSATCVSVCVCEIVLGEMGGEGREWYGKGTSARGRRQRRKNVISCHV